MLPVTAWGPQGTQRMQSGRCGFCRFSPANLCSWGGPYAPQTWGCALLPTTPGTSTVHQAWTWAPREQGRPLQLCLPPLKHRAHGDNGAPTLCIRSCLCIGRLVFGEMLSLSSRAVSTQLLLLHRGPARAWHATAPYRRCRKHAQARSEKSAPSW